MAWSVEVRNGDLADKTTVYRSKHAIDHIHFEYKDLNFKVFAFKSPKPDQSSSSQVSKLTSEIELLKIENS
jgi:hypothetical protein